MIDFDKLLGATFEDRTQKTKESEPVPTPLVKRIGLQQLEAQGSTLRPFSASSLAKFYSALGARRATFDSDGQYAPQGDEKPQKVLEYYHPKKEPFTASPAMLLGSYFEDCAMIPKHVSKNWFVYDAARITERIREDAKKEFKTPISKRLHMQAYEMLEVFRASESRHEFTNPDHYQQRRTGRCNVTDFELVGYTDAESATVVHDLKTAASTELFQEHLYKKLHYWIQAAVYWKMTGKPVTFHVMTSQRPYMVDAFAFDSEQCSVYWDKVVRDILLPLRYFLENGFAARGRRIEPPKWF